MERERNEGNKERMPKKKKKKKVIEREWHTKISGAKG